MVTEFQEHKLKIFFCLFDSDNDGKIEVNDFKKVVDKFVHLKGINKETPEYFNLYNLYLDFWENTLKYADIDDDDKIRYDDFLSYWFDLLKFPQEIEKLILDFGKAFMSIILFDEEENLFSFDNYKIFLTGFGREIVDIENHYRKLLNKEGKITIDDAQQLAIEFFLSNDKTALGNLWFGPLDTGDCIGNK
ncbi:MAG: EF-hand domain-containing protein [Candidatus Heimdallarchaeota archaeon]|nr:EF-hand domain-containing protein [Candidatus Heimdallarchaeota archaeon]